LTAEQATLWSDRYWPTIFNPASQVLQDAPPVNTLKRVRATLEVPAADKYMKLAMLAAAEAHDGGHGRAVGAVVVDPETGAVLAVAGDARWYSHDPAKHESLMANGGAGRPEYHALMRAIAMVANKELRRRLKAGTHKKFQTTCNETPSGQALTAIESRYEDDDKVLRDLTAGFGNLGVAEPDEWPEKQSTTRNEGYLCSGLDIYLTHEPCVCCGMAMIHSRFRACILARKMIGSGSLSAEKGEKRLGYGLFWRRELNWRVMTFQHTRASTLTGDSQLDSGIFNA
jgi:tRNA-specific adenosine deaminase 3